MIVLMGLIWTFLRRLTALTFGVDRPYVAARLERIAPVGLLLRVQPHPLAPIPAPTPELTI